MVPAPDSRKKIRRITQKRENNMALDKPEGLNIGGRFSYNSLTAQQAYDSAHRADSKLQPSMRPATVGDAKANFTVLLNKTGHDTVQEYILKNVLPWFRQEVKDGNPKITIDDDGLDILEKNIKDEKWNSKLGSIPFNNLNDKTKELSPNSYASIVLKAYRPGTDIKQEAFVTEEEQLVSKPFSKKAVFPIEDTVFELYSGCYVKATVTFWAGSINGNPYLSASTNAVVFWKDGDPFAGGGSDAEGMIEGDDDDLFMD